MPLNNYIWKMKRDGRQAIFGLVQKPHQKLETTQDRAVLAVTAPISLRLSVWLHLDETITLASRTKTSGITCEWTFELKLGRHIGRQLALLVPEYRVGSRLAP